MKKVITIALLVLLTVGLFISCNADAVGRLFQNEDNPTGVLVTSVTFDLNGITGTAPEAQTITSGDKVPKPEDPSDTVHTFDGWYKTKDTTTGKLSDKWDFDTEIVTEDMTLYAQWTVTIDVILGEFPNNYNDAWVSDYEVKCYKKDGFTYYDLKSKQNVTENVILFHLPPNHFGIPRNTEVVKENDTYKYYEDGVVFGELKLTGGNLSEIKISIPNGMGIDTRANGTYTPAP